MGAVHVEPVLAHKVLLVEQCPIGTQEAVLGKAALAVGCADVERLAERLRVRIVATFYPALAAEPGLRDLCVDGIVLAGGARHGHAEHIDPRHNGGGRSGHRFAVAGQKVGTVGGDEVGNGVLVGPAAG